MSHVRSLVSLVSTVVVAVALTACGDAPTAPSSYASFSTQDLVEGAGAQAVSGNTVKMNYTVWLYDASAPGNKGPELESTEGREPFEFTIGAGAAIKAWEQGVPGMKEGGVRRIVAPPSMAYGQTRNGAIPPNATLVFEVELVLVADTAASG